MRPWRPLTALLHDPSGDRAYVEDSSSFIFSPLSCLSVSLPLCLYDVSLSLLPLSLFSLLHTPCCLYDVSMSLLLLALSASQVLTASVLTACWLTLRVPLFPVPSGSAFRCIALCVHLPIICLFFLYTPCFFFLFSISLYLFLIFLLRPSRILHVPWLFSSSLIYLPRYSVFSSSSYSYLICLTLYSLPCLPNYQGQAMAARTSGPVEFPSVEGVSSLVWVPDKPELLVAG